MSLEDLKETGVLLPEEEWGKHDMRTTVNKPSLALAALLGILSVSFMYLGGGHPLTFVGVGLFFAFMGWVTHISLKAIDAQDAQFEQEREELREELGHCASQGDTPAAGAGQGE